MSVQKGKHSLKFGGEYRRIRNGSSFFNDAFSSIYPWSVEDSITDLNFTGETEKYLFGYPYYGAAYLASASVVPSTGAQPEFYRGYRANEFAAFVQDDWRISSRLTLNLGVRWEYFGPPHNFQKGIDSNFYFGSNVTPLACPSPCNPFFPTSSPFYASVSNGAFAIRDASIWNKDTNNFGPRIGFAWDVFGTQKFVLRAGAGLMYDRIYNNLFENIRFNPPYFSDNQIGIAANGHAVDPVLVYRRIQG
jgi:outer membrane receptor protein involved in Fe transport